MSLLSLLLAAVLAAPCRAQLIVETVALPQTPTGIALPAALETGVGAVSAPDLSARLEPLSSLTLLQPSLHAAPQALRSTARDLRTPNAGARLETLFTGARSRSGLPGLNAAPEGRDDGAVEKPKAAEKKTSDGGRFVVNDEGVPIFGRAAAYYGESRQLADALIEKGVDLSESLDVMDDAYGDVWAKLKAIEAIGAKRRVEEHNVHLPNTLTWVDGVLVEKKGRRTAIHTHRVYFHNADGVSSSEIEEGKRRVSHYLDDAVRQLDKGGKAERQLGKLDRVILAFDTRGYGELKSYLREREKELRKSHQGRFEFAFVDELAAVPKTRDGIRAELGALVRKYKGQEAGVGKIVEGVIYSRYVGLLLELRTVEHFFDQGYTILQSGRELFDEKGHYVTELDTVVKGTDGVIRVVEAKSARVPLPYSEALRSKIEYKLKTYQKYRALMEKNVGGAFEVVFSVDVGPNLGLKPFLEGQRARLEKQYGYKVTFLFLESVPSK